MDSFLKFKIYMANNISFHNRYHALRYRVSGAAIREDSPPSRVNYSI